MMLQAGLISLIAYRAAQEARTMPGCGPAVASMPLLPPLDCGPSRNLFCAFDSGKAQFLPDTDLPSVISGISKSVCKRSLESW
jgi:hypothetical protein